MNLLETWFLRKRSRRNPPTPRQRHANATPTPRQRHGDGARCRCPAPALGCPPCRIRAVSAPYPRRIRVWGAQPTANDGGRGVAPPIGVSSRPPRCYLAAHLACLGVTSRPPDALGGGGGTTAGPATTTSAAPRARHVRGTKAPVSKAHALVVRKARLQSCAVARGVRTTRILKLVLRRGTGTRSWLGKA